MSEATDGRLAGGVAAAVRGNAEISPESRAEPAHPARSARLTAPAALGGGQSAASSLAFAAGPTPPCCLTAGLARSSLALAWRSEFSPPGPGPLQGARKPASEEEQEARAAGRVLSSFRPPDALLSCRRPRERLPTFVSFYFYRSRGETASYSLDLHRPVWWPLLTCGCRALETCPA